MDATAHVERRESELRPERRAAATDKRRHRRYLTFRTGKIVTDFEDIDCAVLDISAGGARLLAPRDAEIPNAFALIVDPEDLRFECSLAWSDGQMAGVAFTQATPHSAAWLLKETLGDAQSPQAGSAGAPAAPSRWDEKPTAPRTATDNRRFSRMRPSGEMIKTGAIIADRSKPAIPCTIIDVSADGVCVEAGGDAPIPQKFALQFGATRKPCRVIWMKGRRIGAAF